jgi:hypothetical protein
VALAGLAAVFSNRLSEWIRVPAPAFFLIAAAVASDLFFHLGSLSIEVDQRIVTAAWWSSFSTVAYTSGGLAFGPRPERSSGSGSPGPRRPPR